MRFRIDPEIRRKWENGLIAATIALFAAATAVNMDSLFFSVRREPTAFGFVCSALYLTVWLSAALLLKDRAGWVRLAFAVRWTVLLVIALAVTADASAGYSVFSAVRAMAYALSISAYGGLPRIFWLYYLLPAVQALIAGALLVRRRKLRPEG